MSATRDRCVARRDCSPGPFRVALSAEQPDRGGAFTMTDHPDDRRLSLSRRDFLRRAGVTGIAIPSLAAILAACGSDDNGTTSSGGDGESGGTPQLQLASPDNPVTLPISETNQPIADGLDPEAGPLKIFGYNDYIWKKVLNQFSDQYGVEIEYTVFDTPEEMVAKLQSGSAEFDFIVSITVENVGKLAAGELIQPLNKSYIPNFANVWDVFQDPFYDKGAQFTAPYSVYTTGIGYRNDLVTDDVAGMSNPYDILFDEKYATIPQQPGVHLLNGSRDTISAALLRMGADINTTDADTLDQARQMLLDGVDALGWKFDHVDYTELGQFSVHQTWSGQLVYYQYYLKGSGTTIDQYSYVWPPKDSGSGDGIITNDMFAIPKNAPNPVLAHKMIDFMLDNEHGYTNYSYEGYQPPLNDVTPEKILADGLVPENLANILLTTDDFALGTAQLELPPAANQQWQQIYTEVTGGA
jgi:spermidine/putrescine transport system substrate-binding protein